MASDIDFNRKSFTTGHTGFGVPFATWPDRADVPRNAARPLRYIDRYLTVTQGEVFYITEALVKLEGLERGPAGNTAMTAAVSLARELPREATIVVQETEYTGAGKHHWAQLNFAKEMGVKVRTGDPADNKPGEVIVIPEALEQIHANDFDLGAHAQELRAQRPQAGARRATCRRADDIAFLAADTHSDAAGVGAHAQRAPGGLTWRARTPTPRCAGTSTASPTASSRRASGRSRSRSSSRSSSWRARTPRPRSSARCSCAWASTRVPAWPWSSECEKRGLLGHGAGHVVLHCSTTWQIPVPEAAAKLAAGNGWETVDEKWGARHV